MKALLKASIIATLTSLLAIGNCFAGTNGEKAKNSKYIYIDIPINQPNVNDCYTTSTPNIIINEDWLKVYPNPNEGNFFLEVSHINTDEHIYVNIYSVNGQKVYYTVDRTASEIFKMNLNLMHLPKGFYIIHVKVDQRKITRKLSII